MTPLTHLEKQSQSIVPTAANQLQPKNGLQSLFMDDASFHQAFNEGIEKSRDLSPLARTGLSASILDMSPTALPPVDSSKLAVEEMLENSRFFIVKNRKHEFLGESDPVYSLSQPVPHQKDSLSKGLCTVC